MDYGAKLDVTSLNHRPVVEGLSTSGHCFLVVDLP